MNSYLFKIRVADSEECSCGRVKETVGHLLFRCSRWSSLREEHKIKRLAKGRWGDTATIKFVETADKLDNNRWRRREEDEAESNRGEEGNEEGEESRSERERPLQRGGREMDQRG